MNRRQRILAALGGEKTDQIPIMLHNFMMAAREAGYSMGQYRKDPNVIADTFIQAVEKYDYDGIFLDIDTTLLAGAIGVPVDYPDDQPARCHLPLLKTLEEIKDLPRVDIARSPYIQVAVEAVKLIRRYFKDEIAIRGNCDQCAFSLAGLARKPEEFLVDLYEGDPDLVNRLLDYCADANSQLLELMAHAGADILSNGDSPAGPDVISPDFYRKYAKAYEKMAADKSHSLGKPYIIHICGNSSAIISDMIATGSDGLELDYKTDIQLAHDTMKGRVTFVGNIDPSGVLALGRPSLIEKKTRELLAVFSDTSRFILNAGCGIPATTPSGNLNAMINAAREWRH